MERRDRELRRSEDWVMVREWEVARREEAVERREFLVRRREQMLERDRLEQEERRGRHMAVRHVEVRLEWKII